MNLCQEKLPVLNSDAISNIPKLNKTLDEIKSANIENKEKSDQVSFYSSLHLSFSNIVLNDVKILQTEKCIQQMMETCHQVSISIMENLVSISKKIDALEKTDSK